MKNQEQILEKNKDLTTGMRSGIMNQKAIIKLSNGKKIEILINFLTSYRAEITFPNSVLIHNSPTNKRQIADKTIIYTENKGNVIETEGGYFDFNQFGNRPHNVCGLQVHELKAAGLA